MLIKTRGGQRSRYSEDWLADMPDLSFYLRRDAKVDDDHSYALQDAIDDAHEFVTGRNDAFQAALVRVPWNTWGYNITNVALRSYIRLVGQGGHVLLNNRDVSGQPCLVGHGDGEVGGVLRQVALENILIQGTYQSGHGLELEEYADCLVESCRIRRNGGAGIHGQKGPGGTKSDGLTVRRSYINDNEGGGIFFGVNSHYACISDNTRITGNRTGGVRGTVTMLSMTGGVVTASNGAPALELWNGGGCISGVEFEATPEVTEETSMVRVGRSGESPSRGLVMLGCDFDCYQSAAVPFTHLDVVEADSFVCVGGYMDGNTVGDIRCVRLGPGSRNALLDHVQFGTNVGPGGFTEIMDGGVGTEVRGFATRNA